MNQSQPNQEISVQGKRCPACKCDEISKHEEYKSNGILGPGYRSWLVDHYFWCRNCGVMFKDIKPQTIRT